MQYFLLVVIALMWSFVGIMVKAASGMVGSNVITLCRFLFGVIFLGIYMLIKKEKIKFTWRNKWIWIGVVGKCCNYIFENIAISMGYSYGNIIVGPVQAVFLAFVSVFLFKERMQKSKMVSLFLCILGVFFVSWKGQPLSKFYGIGFVSLILFSISAIGAGVHLMSQKKLMETMQSGSMNFSVFLLCTFITFVPVPFTFKWIGSFSVAAMISLIALGFITGITFYIYANVLKKVSLLPAVIIGNSSVLFTLIWARIFYHDPINSYVVIGAVMILMGIILLNFPYFKLKRKEKIA